MKSHTDKITYTENAVGKATTGGSPDTSDNSLNDASYASKFMPVPPDGGYGWVIVVVCFLGFGLLEGITGTFGVLFPHILRRFEAGRAKTALAGSVFCGTYLITGPLVGALINVMGCRPVAILGGIIATASCVISIFSPTINIFILVFGVLMGAGVGLFYIPICVMPGYYFERKRAVAAGISSSGSGVGLLLMPPLTSAALGEFGLQTTIVLLAGVIMQMIVLGAFMRPLEAPPRTRKVMYETDSSDGENDSKALIGNDVVGTEGAKPKYVSKFPTLYEVEPTIGIPNQKIKLAETEKISIGGKNPGHRLANYTLVQDGCHWKTSDKYHIKPPTRRPEFIQHTINRAVPVFVQSCNELPVREKGKKDSRMQHFRAQNPNLATTKSQMKVLDPKQNVQSTTVSCCELAKLPDLARNGQPIRKIDRKKIEQELLKPFARKDVFYTASILSLPECKAQPNMASYITSVLTLPINTEPASCACACVSEHTQVTIREMLNVSILADPFFIVIALSQSIIQLSYFVPIFFMTDHCLSLGFPASKGALLLSVFGVANAVGRTASGVLANVASLNVLHIYSLSLVGSGVCCVLLVTVCTTLTSLTLVAALLGALCGAFVPLTTVFLVKYLGLSRLTNAYGYLSLMKGIVGVMGPAIAGALLDATNSYKIPYFFSGSMYILAGLLPYLLPLVQRWKNTSPYGD